MLRDAVSIGTKTDRSRTTITEDKRRHKVRGERSEVSSQLMRRWKERDEREKEKQKEEEGERQHGKRLTSIRRNERLLYVCLMLPKSCFSTFLI